MVSNIRELSKKIEKMGWESCMIIKGNLCLRLYGKMINFRLK
jgi:hypothetical protein